MKNFNFTRQKLFTSTIFLLFILTDYGLSQTTYYSRVNNGSWSDASTWSTVGCGGAQAGSAPEATDNVIICDGYTVINYENGAGVTINDVTINSGGVINGNGKKITINGNLTVNGTYYGGGQPIEFTGGGGETIDGSGVINLNNNKQLNINGDASIASSADLYILGQISIGAGITLTNNGTIETTAKIDGKDGTSTWTNASDSYVKVGNSFMITAGVLNASASGNTVEYSDDADENILTPSSSTYYNLVISGSGTKTQLAALVISNNFTINSGIYDPDGQNLEVKGNWSNSGTYSEGTETVTFNGTGSQSLTNSSGENFYNLIINKSSGTLTLNNDVTVTNTLNFNDGIIDTDDNTLTLGNSGTEGTFTHANNAIIIGEFERWIDETNTSVQYLFPTGTESYYRPIKITFDDLDVTGAPTYGSLIAKFVDSPPGGLNPRPTADASTGTNVYNTFSNGYWALTAANSLTSTQYDMELTGTGFDAFDIDSDTRLFTRANSGSNWDDDGSHVNAVNVTAKRADITTLSAEYCFADITNCTAPSTSAITGGDSVCINGIDSTFYVDFSSGSTYEWSLMPASAGTITDQNDGGDSKSTITVTWSGTGQDITVKVIETNSCTTGDPQTLDITSHPVAPTSITGQTAVPENETDVVYSVTDLGYTYDWSVTGGTLASSTGTNTITVDWGSAGTGNLEVAASNGCGTSSAYDIDVDKYIIIESVQTGNWSAESTWDCNCVPISTDNVKILSGHTVTLTGNTEIGYLTIKTGGSLDGSNKQLTVTGDFIVDGSYSSSADVHLEGIGTNLGGTGSINVGPTKDLNIENGSKTILSTAILTFVGNLDIAAAGLSVTNEGSIEIESDLVAFDNTVTWTNSTNSILKVGGTLMTNGVLNASASGNLVEYNGDGAQTIKTPNSNQYYNLHLSGTGTKSLSAAIDIDGNLTINGSSVMDVTAANNYGITIAGDWTDTSSTADAFLEQNGTVTFNGTSAQTITRSSGATTETFYGLTVNKSSGNLELANNVDVSNALTMTQGIIDANSSTFTLGTSTPTEGTLLYTAGRIVATSGNFLRWFTSTGDKSFPIGSSSTYYPINLTINTLGSNGSVSSNFTASDPGGSGDLPITDGSVDVTNQYTDGYWSFIGGGGISVTDYDLTVTGTGFSSYSINSATRILLRSSGGSWQDVIPGSHSNASGSKCYRTDITTFNLSNGTTYEYGLGHTDCEAIAKPTISGSSDVCMDASENYSVTNNGNTYTWTITNGTISAGTSTATITVHWQNSASIEGEVKVYESSGCYDSDPDSLAVTIHSLSTSSISGPTSVPENTTQGPYTVNERSGYTYTWSVAVGNGSPTPTTGSSIYVDWGNASAATLRVVGQYGSCTAAANEDLAVTVFQLVESNGTGGGDWNDPNSWDADPLLSTESAKIVNGDVITLTKAEQITHLYIANGTLNQAGFDLTVTASYTNDDTHNTADGNLILDASAATTINGDGGTLNLGTGQLQINNFDHEILSTATLSVTGDISVDNDITVTNSGSITISGDILGSNAASTWNNSTNATLNIDGAILATGVLFANASGNTVNYNGTSPQTIKDPYSDIYYNLSCSGSSTKSLSADVDINGNLSISGTDVLDVTGSNYQINLAGNWTNSSAAADPFVQQAGRVTLDGGTDQTITNTNDETFYDLYIVKSLGGGVILAAGSDITISNYASFQKGVIDAATNSCLVNFPDGSDSNGGDSDSFIDGQTKKTGNDAFIFPLGDGAVWARLGISGPSNATTEYTGQYFYTAYSDLSVTGLLNNVSTTEYWTLSQAINDDDVSVTLYWEDASRSGIDDYASSDLVVAHFNGADWENVGQASISGGSVGSVTSNVMPDYSPVGFGSEGGGQNPLPVELIDFSAASLDKRIKITWATASEYANDYFILEKSADSKNFEELSYHQGAGFSSQMIQYREIDDRPFEGVNYYRLKQVDLYGNIEYSNIIAINGYYQYQFGNKPRVYPNPASVDEISINCEDLNVDQLNLIVADRAGNVVVDEVIILSEYIDKAVKLNISELVSGTYIIIGITDNAIVFRENLLVF